MRYMLIMRVTDAAVEASADIDFTEIIAAMGRYNESLLEAGVLLAAEGLADASEGFVIDFATDAHLVTDGPYGETKELFNGYWILDVASKEEAAEWGRRCPLGPGAKLEVRRISELSDFDIDDEWIQKEAGMRDELDARAQQRLEGQA